MTVSSATAQKEFSVEKNNIVCVCSPRDFPHGGK